MIFWFGAVIIAVALISAVLSLGVFVRGRGPNDFTILPAILSAALLFIQIVIMIVAPLVGNSPKGDLLEIWLYLITAFALPVGAVVWALTDRTKWSNVVLAIVQFSIAVMTWRMLSLWLTG